jgi:hypothetical protein
MPTPHESDKDRFEKIKQHEMDRGRDEATAEKVAAQQVEELRKQEGPSGGGDSNFDSEN